MWIQLGRDEGIKMRDDIFEEPTEVELLQNKVEELENRVQDWEIRFDELNQRYDKAFEELCKILDISCWAGCQICFKKK
jgi:predicted  nucleic acid-binding Zn-ribbon protein